MRMLFFLYVSTLLTACATPVTNVEPVPLKGQSLIFQAGNGLVNSIAQNSMVALQAGSQTLSSDQHLVLVVGVFNSSPQSFDVSPENIEVLVNGHSAKLETREDRVTSAKRKRFGQILLMSWATAGDRDRANAAGYSSHEGTIRSGGQTATYSGTTYNPEVASQAQTEALARNQSMASSINSKADASIASFDAMSFMKTTLPPNAAYTGAVTLADKLQISTSADVNIRVNAGGDVHEFLVKLRPAP